MRHRVKGRKLNRTTAQRKALFRRLISSLFLKEEIKTTLPKAKAIKGLIDKLITKARKGTLHNQRLVHAFLQNKKATKRLIEKIAPRFKKRISGFTRIVRLGRRRGDAAEIVRIELVEKEKKKEKKKTSSKKSGKKVKK
ncbi:50S ribosomal protein L17 [Candidatus Microgenomates bacterium]|nr:50S ribosomal protein L17 [Candidatus Microgenomates bacterium]